MPASALASSARLASRAWLAARQGDRRAERSALEALIVLEPTDASAYERLADLAAQEGDIEGVAALRHRKAAAEAALDRYKTLINLSDMAPHSADLARAAEVIGRRFDAKAWWRLAVRRDPANEKEAAAALERMARIESSPGPAPEGRTLAELLGPTGPRPAATNTSLEGATIPTFGDEAEQRGISFRYENGRTELRQLPETMGSGVAILDFDGDGWLDIYVIQGGPFPPAESARRDEGDRGKDARAGESASDERRQGAPAPMGDRLFRNRGGGRFEDATASSGLAGLPGGYGHGVAVGDYDNDGRPDLFVTRWRSYALYHNRGGGRYEEVTVRAGLGGDRDWPTSAAWADLDNDGDLDLYVCHYLEWDAANPVLCEIPGKTKPGHSYCDPRGIAAQPDHVFRNDGGRFVDVTKEAGIVDHDGRGLGVVAADLDDDGKVDLFVANDTSANYFFRNKGGFRFEEKGEESGLAASATGGYLAGMGVACGDLDGDGRIDLAVTNFFGESTTLYHNHGNGIFSDRSAAAGLAAPTRFMLGFGLAAPRRRQRRPARPGPGQRPRQRLPALAPLCDARAALHR